jgi:hypothetical protein
MAAVSPTRRSDPRPPWLDPELRANDEACRAIDYAFAVRHGAARPRCAPSAPTRSR